MRRIFAGQNAFHNDVILITDHDDIAYISGVLRMKTGDSLLVSDGVSRACETRITAISKTAIELRVQAECLFETGRKTEITLYQGMPKGAKMDEIVRKSTELGVRRILPIVTCRSVSSANNKSGASQEKIRRWRRIAEEAARQSQRMEIPEVGDVISLPEAVKGLKNEDYDIVLILFELEEKLSLKEALRDRMPEFPKIAVFIGPEGGFEQEEVDLLVSHGAVTVTVGETILRTETAGPAAIAMIMYEMEL